MRCGHQPGNRVALGVEVDTVKGCTCWSLVLPELASSSSAEGHTKPGSRPEWTRLGCGLPALSFQHFGLSISGPLFFLTPLLTFIPMVMTSHCRKLQPSAINSILSALSLIPSLTFLQHSLESSNTNNSSTYQFWQSTYLYLLFTV